MPFFHQLEHLNRDLKLWRMNIRMSRQIRRQDELSEDGLIYRPGRAEDLKQIDELHIRVFRQPMVGWIRFVYRFRAPQLIGVVTDGDGQLVGYDAFMFNEVEYRERIIHEQYVAVAPAYQGKGISTKLRRYSIASYDDGFLTGVSTLAQEHDIKALRSAQKSGYAITKMSAKPKAYYLFIPLRARFSNSPADL